MSIPRCINPPITAAALAQYGRRMWRALVECGNIEAAVARLVQEYDVDYNTLGSDFRQFAHRLLAKGLLAVDGKPVA